ncbi:MAG: protein phosphatase 2C domain-containing protein [Kofleriaceae bacterium]
MDTISVATAAVTGARHLRTARNGQDAAQAWTGGRTGAIVVCDGCGAGGSSEVGARLGAQLAIAVVAEQLAAGIPAPDVWPAVRARVAAVLDRLVAAMPGKREQIVHDHFLFTIVAAAWDGERVAVWALGDGGYALGSRICELAPFAENQPPYLGYDLLGMPHDAHLEVADGACGHAIVATDGATELGLARFTGPRFLAHPDALRRQLTVDARGNDRIEWAARRVQREAAALQDDGAVAILRWGACRGDCS